MRSRDAGEQEGRVVSHRDNGHVTVARLLLLSIIRSDRQSSSGSSPHQHTHSWISAKTMDEEYTDARLFVTFEKHQEFLDKQQSLLSLDLFQEPEQEENRREEQILKDLRDIVSRISRPFLNRSIKRLNIARRVSGAVLLVRSISRTTCDTGSRSSQSSCTEYVWRATIYSTCNPCCSYCPSPVQLHQVSRLQDN